MNSLLSTNQPFLSLINGPVDSTSYASVLESCKCPNLGKQIHAHIVKNGFSGHEFLETKLLQMYGRCGSVEYSSLVFDKMPQRNIYSWAGIITVYTDHGYFEEALSLFQELQLEEICLEFFVFPVVLKACSGLSELGLGKQVHGLVIKNELVSNIYVGNSLIDMYGKCGSLDNAKKFLDKMPERDCVSWNSVVTGCAANGLVFEALEVLENMGSSGNLKPNLVSWSAVIGGFTQNGYDEEALELLYRMQKAGLKPNARTLASFLPACARLQTLSLGKEIHGYITRHGFMSNPFAVNGLVDVYRRCADMRSAEKIFLKFSVRNLVSFNTMIVGYCENGKVSKAKKLFDHIELVGIKKDTISWNSMISGYVDNGLFNDALKIFRDSQYEGVEADSFTLGSALTACADLAALRQGKEIHSYAISRCLHSNPFVGGSLVELYCKSGDLAAAQMVFDEVIERDITTWNALISGYARCNRKEEVDKLVVTMKTEGLELNIYTWNGILAGYMENGENESVLQLFSEMQNSNLKPDIYTIGIILPVCTRLATIERGKQIHGYSIRCGYDMGVHIGASLVDMYAKCGFISNAELAFNRISKPNLVSRNALLAGYAMHGLGEEGFVFFRKMLAEGIRPDSVTFLSVLSSCVHAGSVDLGCKYFDLMKEYNIEPTVKHYTCMVDLLSRAGRLCEAYELVKQMKVEPDCVTWGSLLGGCVIHRNVGLGEIAAQKLIELDPNNSGNYILLANLYASSGRWDDLARTRQIIKDRGMQKSPGCSWIEDRDEMHVFLAYDRTHVRTEEIYETLDNLSIQMKKDGYTVDSLPNCNMK
ncbi:Pentatricopeptide repeat [Macleaya cordata]|uniref:Pentatricopeptide repeat n=1 Tax=Macleaya cordata TaxID=56857 RepID=A0A200Q798_MACCD|nr:Pentatricopeptide repeat [Macleaya cordata]